MEEQLKPLFALLEDINSKLAKGGKVPYFGTLKDWAQARPRILSALTILIALVWVHLYVFSRLPHATWKMPLRLLCADS